MHSPIIGSLFSCACVVEEHKDYSIRILDYLESVKNSTQSVHHSDNIHTLGDVPHLTANPSALSLLQKQ